MVERDHLKQRTARRLAEVLSEEFETPVKYIRALRIFEKLDVTVAKLSGEGEPLLQFSPKLASPQERTREGLKKLCKQDPKAFQEALEGEAYWQQVAREVHQEVQAEAKAQQEGFPTTVEELKHFWSADPEVFRFTEEDMEFWEVLHQRQFEQEAKPLALSPEDFEHRRLLEAKKTRSHRLSHPLDKVRFIPNSPCITEHLKWRLHHPLSIIGSKGRGKTTFARHFVKTLLEDIEPWEIYLAGDETLTGGFEEATPLESYDELSEVVEELLQRGEGERPVLLVVDVGVDFTGGPLSDALVPLYEALQELAARGHTRRVHLILVGSGSGRAQDKLYQEVRFTGPVGVGYTENDEEFIFKPGK